MTISKLSNVMSVHLQEQVCAVRGGVGSGEVKRSLLEGVAGSTSVKFIKSKQREGLMELHVLRWED